MPSTPRLPFDNNRVPLFLGNEHPDIARQVAGFLVMRNVIAGMKVEVRRQYPFPGSQSLELNFASSSGVHKHIGVKDALGFIVDDSPPHFIVRFHTIIGRSGVPKVLEMIARGPGVGDLVFTFWWAPNICPRSRKIIALPTFVKSVRRAIAFSEKIHFLGKKTRVF